MLGGATQGRFLTIFGVLFLCVQVLQIYQLSTTRQSVEVQWTRSLLRMESIRNDLVRSVERAMKQFEADLKRAERESCQAATASLAQISEILMKAMAPPTLPPTPPPPPPPSPCPELPSGVLGALAQNGSKCVRSYVGMPPPETCRTLKDRHVAIVTIDSLRYDTATQAKAPWFSSFFKSQNSTGWERRLGHATFSLPAHIVILHGGSFGTRGYLQQHKDPQRLFGFLLNWMAGDWANMKPPRYILPEASNLVKAFEKCGYETIGVGGVSWFNDVYETTDLWARDYFQRFVWRERFTPSSNDAFEYQLAETKHLMETRNASMPLFFFMNVPSVHFPYRHSKKEGLAQQMEAYEYVDEHFQTLLDLLPRPLQLIVQADHGECFSDDCHGHGTAHPDVFDLPFFEIVLEEGEGFSNPDPAKRRKPRLEWTPRTRGEFFRWGI